MRSLSAPALSRCTGNAEMLHLHGVTRVMYPRDGKEIIKKESVGHTRLEVLFAPSSRIPRLKVLSPKPISGCKQSVHAH